MLDRPAQPTQEPALFPVDSGSAKRADKDPSQIEVTPEMEAAGFEVLCNSGIADEYLGADKLLVVEIYRAMHARSPLASGLTQTPQTMQQAAGRSRIVQ